jgi:hypothetical protein
MNSLLLPALLAASCLANPASAAEPPAPIPRAHAHNDYLHERPLLDALDQGFCSVEADIFLVDGELRVGHSAFELRKGRTLEALYLKPLAERVRAKEGSVYPVKERFLLLIDIKKDGAAVYPVLDALLERYAELFTAHLDGKAQPGPVTAILSGDRPRDLVAADPTRYCAIDGRPPDLVAGSPPDLVPLISDAWSNHFQWRGRGEITPEELVKLKDFVATAHKDNRLLRFWAIPDNEACWRILHDAGVDLINTDKLADLAKFLNTTSESRP